MGWIDIYRVDCVNPTWQKPSIDFRRCVNGNTIEDRDTGSCLDGRRLGARISSSQAFLSASDWGLATGRHETDQTRYCT